MSAYQLILNSSGYITLKDIAFIHGSSNHNYFLMQSSICPIGRRWAFSTSQVYLYTAIIIIFTAVVNIISIAALMPSTCGVENAQRRPMGSCKLLTLGCSQVSDLL